MGVIKTSFIGAFPLPRAFLNKTISSDLKISQVVVFSCIMSRTSNFIQIHPSSPYHHQPPPSPSNSNPPLRTTSNDRGKCSASLFRNLAFIRCVHAACEECYTSSLSMETHYWNWKLNISKTMPTTSKVPPANMFCQLAETFHPNQGPKHNP